MVKQVHQPKNPTGSPSSENKPLTPPLLHQHQLFKKRKATRALHTRRWATWTWYLHLSSSWHKCQSQLVQGLLSETSGRAVDSRSLNLTVRKQTLSHFQDTTTSQNLLPGPKQRTSTHQKSSHLSHPNGTKVTLVDRKGQVDEYALEKRAQKSFQIV